MWPQRSLDLALHNPVANGHYLQAAEPYISAPGGIFLILTGLGFFLDEAKKEHWWPQLETRLASWGRLSGLTVYVGLCLALLSGIAASGDMVHRGIMFAVATSGVGLRVLLDRYLPEDGISVGGVARKAFIAINCQNLGFSLDDAIGSFSFTNDLVLIVIGLGIGVVWVQSMTVHVVQANVLDRWLYLVHGAQWSIFALGVCTLPGAWGWNSPQWLTGGVSLALIATALVTSWVANKRLPAVTDPQLELESA